MKIVVICFLVAGGLFFLKARKDTAIRDAREAQHAQKIAMAEKLAVEPTRAPYVRCALSSKCSVLRTFEESCRIDRSTKKCRFFVKFFKLLTAKANCMRRKDKAPVPAVWLCDEDAAETTYPKLHERSVQMLSELTTPAAKKLYGSEALRNTLYGYLKEKHFEKSLAVEALLPAKKK